MKTIKIGKAFFTIGLLLMLAALGIVIYNLQDEARAANTAANALREIIDETDDFDLNNSIYANDLTDSAMHTVEIDGLSYVGVVDIPSLERSLPVLNEWSYSNLKISPCRYQGSAYADDLIIMAHNYRSHFGRLLKLQIGDEIYFTDVNGNVFSYTVVEMETLGKSDVEEMSNGDWDLTLFTCTVGGRTRITVRCERSN